MLVGYWMAAVSLESGGISPYAWRLLELLLEKSDCRLIIFCSKKNKIRCLSIINDYNKSNALVKTIPTTPRFFFGKILKKINKLYITMWIKSLSLDILHVPYQNIPRYFEKMLPCPVAITMHDVQEIHFPEFFTPQERARRANNYLKSLIISEAIVVSFDHVKEDLIKYFSLPKNKIYVCPLPYQKIVLTLPTEQEKYIYKYKYLKYGFFLLYPAQTWEHKNHLSLIKAVQLIREQYGQIIHVVCTGKTNPLFFPKILEYIEINNLSDQIHFMGIVPESELYWLYKSCRLVVIPSLYEAGSFPLLEAMSLESPVICSSITSLPETIGDLRFVFDPLNIDQLKKLIMQMTEDSKLRLENIRNSKDRISQLMEIDSVSCYINMWKRLNFEA